MTAYASRVEDLALHGPRVLGYATAARVAERFGLDRAEVEEHLLDHQARGWVTLSTFADSSGWSATAAGRAEGERRLAAELDAAGARPAVVAAHAGFLPLNTRLLAACTKWQLRPTPGDPMAANDHTDWGWDERVLRTLESVGTSLVPLMRPLAGALERFGGYPERFAAALARVDRGQRHYVDAPDVDSCHTVWIQLHEDLLATLGLERGTDG